MLAHGEPEWTFTADKRTPFKYCEGTLQTTGLVSMQERRVHRTTVATTKIADDGRTTGLAVVGGVMPIAARPESLPQQEVLSSTVRCTPGKTPLRILLYQSLLDSPTGSLTPRELSPLCQTTTAVIEAAAKDLSQRGIVTIDNPLDPGTRIFTLSGARGILNREQLTPQTLAVINMLDDLQQRGITTLSGLDILAHITQRLPGLDPYKALSSLGRWMKHKNRKYEYGLIREITSDSGRRQLHISLSEAYKKQIEDLLEVRKLVATDQEYVADAAAQALKMMQRRRTVRRLLQGAYDNSRPTNAAKVRWADEVADYVPEEGISMSELHEIISARFGISIVYQAFRNSIRAHPELYLETRRAGRTNRAHRYVFARHYYFPADWAGQARCLAPDMDLRIFNRNEGNATPDEIEETKRICRGCPVRRACLKKALEDEESWGIRGAMTDSERIDLKPLTKQRFLRTIVVGD